MNEINTILQSLKQIVSTTELQQMAVIVSGLLAMSGSVTMLNLARWTGEGGSYRTVQRFYNAPLNWLQMNWALSQMSCQTTGGIHLLVGDETVVTKAGKESFGLGRFFSSIYQRCVPGLCFFGVSLVSVANSESTMLLFEQQSKGESTVKSRDASQKPSQSAVTKATKRKGGRPKGSQNQNRRSVELSPALQKIQGYLRQVLLLIGDKVNIPYCVLDGAYGNNPALQMVRQLDLHLISKLNKTAALYFPFQGEQKQRGARRKYGSKLDYRQLPAAYRKQSSVDAGVQTDLYQMQLFSKQFPDLLNVVIIVKTKLATHQSAHVVLFSSDLALAHDSLIHYYRLRFQIEFNFRQAKQFWGLEDFMNVKQLPVYNAANLALFMTNFSSALLRLRRATIPDFGLHDLKADFRSRFYLTQTLKRLPFLPDSVSIDDLFSHLSRIGAVHS